VTPTPREPVAAQTEAVEDRFFVVRMNAGLGSLASESLLEPAMQAKSFFYHLLTTTRVTLALGYVSRWQMWPIPRPHDGLPIQIERLR
jgi:hypothetical protein